MQHPIESETVWSGLDFRLHDWMETSLHISVTVFVRHLSVFNKKKQQDADVGWSGWIQMSSMFLPLGCFKAQLQISLKDIKHTDWENTDRIWAQKRDLFCWVRKVTVVTSVFTAAGFLVVFPAVLRLGALSPKSSSECSVLVSDWSELCWDEASSARDAAATERAAGLEKVTQTF